MPNVTKSLGEGTQSVLLTVAIIERIAASETPVSVSRLAKEIGTSKSRVFRHLQTLASCDFIAKDDATGQYEVGSKLLMLGRSIQGRLDIVAIAEPLMRELRDRFGHSVIVSRVSDHGVQVLKSISGNSPIVLEIRSGTTLPFASSAQGRLALALLGPQAGRTNPALAKAYRAFVKERGDELRMIAQQGWVAAQMREGLNGIAVPVFDGAGRLVATLAMLDTVSDIGRVVSTSTIEALQQAAAELSSRIG